MHLLEIWRYPVKSMAGERLDQVLVRDDGLTGDRLVHVADTAGQIVTARQYPRLLRHLATLDTDGEALVDGRPWSSPAVADDVRADVDAGAQLVRDDSPARFDIHPLLVATDGALAAFGRDRRRLRPNLVVSGVDGLDERQWPGRTLRIGEVRIAIRSLRQRCIMTTYDPDTQARDPGVLRDIVRRFGGRLALDCEVRQGGSIRVGDVVEFAV